MTRAPFAEANGGAAHRAAGTVARFRHWLVCLLLLPACCAAVDFTADERARILSHGPWPPARVADASNRADGQPAAIDLGRRLFAERRLSASGEIACSSCHDPQRGFQDGRRFTRNQRNTPALLDLAFMRWFGWDGAQDSLWAASLRPLTASDELAATPHQVLRLLRAEPGLGASYQAAFGALPDGEHPQLLLNTAKALAAYQATLVSPRTPFDDFRDAVAHGDATAAARYPQAAQRGLKLFVGDGRCWFCHSGPAFTNGEFADIGRPFFTGQGADPGRWGGLKQLLASPFNRLGPYNDAGANDTRAVATRHVTMEPRHFGEFKVPGLRGLNATAPYFHDGSAATLGDVVDHYADLDESRLHADGERILRALRLTPQQRQDLVAFLESLSVR